MFDGQQSYVPNGVSPVWLVIGIQPLATEEPYEGNLHVLWGGRRVTGAFTRKPTAISCG